MVSAGGSQGQTWKDCHLSPSSGEGMCRFQGQPGRTGPFLPPPLFPVPLNGEFSDLVLKDSIRKPEMSLQEKEKGESSGGTERSPAE